MADNKLLGAGSLYYGGNEISKAYMGNNLVWEKKTFVPSFSYEHLRHNEKIIFNNSDGAPQKYIESNKILSPVHTTENNFDLLTYTYQGYSGSDPYFGADKVTISGVSKLKITLDYINWRYDNWNYIQPYISLSNNILHTSKYFSTSSGLYTYTYIGNAAGVINRAENVYYYSSRWNYNNTYYYTMAWNHPTNTGMGKYWGFQDIDYTPNSSKIPSPIITGDTANTSVSNTYILNPQETYTLSVAVYFSLYFQQAYQRKGQCSVKFEYL